VCLCVGVATVTDRDGHGWFRGVEALDHEI
jgi:hypothetical protein